MNIQFKKGILKYCVLIILDSEDCYGYELVSKISNYVNVSEGTIYPLLKRLRDKELVETYLVESSDGPARKYYRLTSMGEASFNQLDKEWLEFKFGIEKLRNEFGGKNE